MAGEPLRTPSGEGRERLLSRHGEPLFIAGWERTLFKANVEVHENALLCKAWTWFAKSRIGGAN
jgi:hypothetical protein